MSVLNYLSPAREGSAAANNNAPVSGGGLSENKKFSYGYSSVRGKRASMEDFHDTKISEVNGEMVGLFGVFDGHGGSRAAEFVQKNLFNNLLTHPKFSSDTELLLRRHTSKQIKSI